MSHQTGPSEWGALPPGGHLPPKRPRWWRLGLAAVGVLAVGALVLGVYLAGRG